MAKAADKRDETEPAKVREPDKRIRITALKVFTRHGRFTEGQWVEIPASEADKLIAEGHAVA